MNLLFFGSSQRQLFGAYHTPAAGRPARGAALLCPPWGQEYLVSHRILRRLAVRLSERGYHVLRFDYYGTGDSAGERVENDLATWQDDANVAMDELRDMSGFAEIATFGIRLGSVVAWRLAVERSEVHTTVLWDPVVNGRDYLRELVAAQAEMERWSLTPVAKFDDSPDVQNLLGFPMTPAMRTSIEQVDLGEFSARFKGQLRVFYSDDLPGRERLHAALHAAGVPYHAETIHGQTPWREDENVGANGVPVLVLERMAELLG